LPFGCSGGGGRGIPFSPLLLFFFFFGGGIVVKGREARGGASRVWTSGGMGPIDPSILPRWKWWEGEEGRSQQPSFTPTMAATHGTHAEPILFRDEQAKVNRIKKRWERDLDKGMEEATSKGDAKLAAQAMRRCAWQVVESTLHTEKENKVLERRVQEAHEDAKKWRTESEKQSAQCERLKSLCQELQKRNGDIVESSRKMIEEEEAKRRKHADTVSKTVEDVQAKIQASHEEREVQLKNNIELQNRMDHIRNEYGESLDELRRNLEAKAESVKTMETKLSEAYSLAAHWKSKAEEQVKLHEKTVEREKIMVAQIDEYRIKFQEVQNTMTKSTEIIQSFKQETKALADKLRLTNQENAGLQKLVEKLRGRCSKANTSLIEANERKSQLSATLAAMKKENERIKSQKEKLESLCRHLKEVNVTTSNNEPKL